MVKTSWHWLTDKHIGYVLFEYPIPDFITLSERLSTWFQDVNMNLPINSFHMMSETSAFSRWRSGNWGKVLRPVGNDHQHCSNICTVYNWPRKKKNGSLLLLSLRNSSMQCLSHSPNISAKLTLYSQSVTPSKCNNPPSPPRILRFKSKSQTNTYVMR